MKVTYFGRTESGKLSQAIIFGRIGKEFKTAIWIITPAGKRVSVKRADIISIEEETRYRGCKK